MLFGGYLLFKNAAAIREKMQAMMPQKEQPRPVIVDEDAVGGMGLGGGSSQFVGNRDLFND